MSDDVPEGMRRTPGGLFVPERPAVGWKESTASALLVPAHVDTTGHDRTCVAGPLADPNPPGRKKEPNLLGFIPTPGHPLGWVTVHDTIGSGDSRRRPAIGIFAIAPTCSSYVGKSRIPFVLATGGRCTHEPALPAVEKT